MKGFGITKAFEDITEHRLLMCSGNMRKGGEKKPKINKERRKKDFMRTFVSEI